MSLKHRLEAGLVIGVYYALRALPLDVASGIGARFGMWLGPKLKRHNHVATCNLALAFPEKSEKERADILRRMWAHLGRNAAELAHFKGNRLYERISCKGLENLPSPGVPVLFISGHFGHWELTYPVAYEHGLSITLAYRHLNNPILDHFMASIRGSHCTAMFPKGRHGAAKMMGAIKRKESLALLIDQKMNEGIPIPFFGRDAMTAPAVAQLALRFNMPIIPARTMRVGGCHFVGTSYPPIVYEKTGDDAADARSIMLKIHAMFEGWVREYPEQWMWIHRRWEKEMYK